MQLPTLGLLRLSLTPGEGQWWRASHPSPLVPSVVPMGVDWAKRRANEAAAQAVSKKARLEAMADRSLDDLNREFEDVGLSLANLVANGEGEGERATELEAAYEELEKAIALKKQRAREEAAAAAAAAAAGVPSESPAFKKRTREDVMARVQALRTKATARTDEEEEELRELQQETRLWLQERKASDEALARAALKAKRLANREKAITDPEHWKAYLTNLTEEKWWETYGRRLSQQRRARDEKAHLYEIANKMGHPRPAVRPAAGGPVTFTWPSSTLSDDAFGEELDKQLERLGLGVVDEARREAEAEEEWLRPVRVRINKAKAKAEREAAEAAARAQEAREGAYQQEGARDSLTIAIEAQEEAHQKSVAEREAAKEAARVKRQKEREKRVLGGKK